MSSNDENLARYYQLHSHFYDATRWSFLFGRDLLVQSIGQFSQPHEILEVGCGTGHNIIQLAKKFPTARITGLDLSDDMLAIARKKTTHYSDRVELRKTAQVGSDQRLFDVVVFSYSLSMMNPGWESVLRQSLTDLKPGGLLCAVDFHQSGWRFFQSHMAKNHVKMEAHLQPFLAQHLEPRLSEVRSAYWGLWQYFLFIGQKG
jgi:S-adenosylmethionine-diacylgycerolhomoserine-N-methlytransferase